MNLPSRKTHNIQFGTDGWRAVIADQFTFENVRIVSQAICDWLRQETLARTPDPRQVAVGYDTRFLSDQFARIVSCVLAQNGWKVFLSPTPIPTPALSYGVTRVGGAAGIMITASHNPAPFNGIKIKTAQGGGASVEITQKIENCLLKSKVQSMDFNEALKKKRILYHDFRNDHVLFIRRYLDLTKIRKARFRVLTDIMHGSGGRQMADILKGTCVHLQLMREDINPCFEGGKPEPVIAYLQGIITRMKKEKFDLGLVLDGDADRIAAIASGGEFIHPQKILGLLILHLVRHRGRRGGVVKTICGTTLIDKIAEKLKLRLFETPVGFKHISDLMVTENIIAGGEEAGGMGFQDFIPERDGILAGLLLLETMVYQKKNIKQIVWEMEREFGRYYYLRLDIRADPHAIDLKRFRTTRSLLGKKVIQVKDFDGIKCICEDESWLMLRPSGTEPLIRAYAEARTLMRAKDMLQLGQSLVRA